MYKGANSKSVRKQPYSDILAKQRAFSLKSGYMTSIKKVYFRRRKIDSIIKDKFEIKHKNIEDIVYETFKPYYNWTIDALCEYFNIERKSKNLNYRIASAILNLKGKVKK